MAENIKNAMNMHLWNVDHYITQINPDKTTRDFVDYDSQVMAVAFGVCPPDKISTFLKRVDSGPCTHARATYVSEKYYGPNDCYVQNTGDSAVTMGRIGWADGLARKVIGDANTFNSLVQPLQNDLNKNTWMYERYQCNGQPTHNAFYIEYPAVVAMFLRYMRYGINIGLTSLTIDPLGVTSYTYKLGDVYVVYSSDSIIIQIKPNGPNMVQIYQVHKNTQYSVVSLNTDTNQKVTQTVTSDNQGTLIFKTALGPNWLITATANK